MAGERPIIVHETDGTTTRYACIAEAARAMDLSVTAIRNRIHKCVESEKRVFEYAKPQEAKRPVKEKKRLNTRVYVAFEKRCGYVCVTDCPFYLGERSPKVGSVLCKQCSSFHGIDEVNQTVCCSHARNNLK